MIYAIDSKYYWSFLTGKQGETDDKILHALKMFNVRMISTSSNDWFYDQDYSANKHDVTRNKFVYSSVYNMVRTKQGLPYLSYDDCSADDLDTL
jgi:hypothetical protein